LSYHRPDLGGRVKGAVCQIVVKKGQVRLDFIHGIRLADPRGLLQGDRLSKRFVPIGCVADAKAPAVADLIREAGALTRQNGLKNECGDIPMKCLLYVLAAVFTLASVSAVWADNEREQKPRFKGVELYSWKMEGEWIFVLLDGTNRVKETQTIKEAENQITGVADLKKALARLAVGEQVSWTNRQQGFEFPPKATRKEIKKAADAAKIKLRIAEDDE
jgi:hypothetical protein